MYRYMSIYVHITSFDFLVQGTTHEMNLSLPQPPRWAYKTHQNRFHQNLKRGKPKARQADTVALLGPSRKTQGYVSRGVSVMPLKRLK